jgi:hypothetical protein
MVITPRFKEQKQMAKAILVTNMTQVGENAFTATGTCNERNFLAKTIIYRNEPIFKVQETDKEGKVTHLRMDVSSFDRGDRIAIARHLKLVRLGTVEVDGPSLAELTVAQLRLKAKALSVEGYRDGSVRKADLVALIETAQDSQTAEA